MALKFLESGTDATSDLVSWSGGISGGCASSTAQQHTGPRSLLCDTGGGAVSAIANSATGLLADAGRRISGWFHFSGTPAALGTILNLVQSGGTSVGNIGLNTSRQLELGLPSVHQGTGATPTVLTAGTWYRLSVSYVITNTTTFEFRVYLNGNLEISKANDETLVNVTTSILRVQSQGSLGANFKVYWDDIYVDDTADLTDPGDIRVTSKRPNANGSVNTFDTTTSTTNSGYGTGNSIYMNERPLATTGARRQNGTGTPPRSRAPKPRVTPGRCCQRRLQR